MTQPGTIGWFARHEIRLAWRDWLSILPGGRRAQGNAGKTRTMVIGILVFAAVMHGLAWLMLYSSASLSGSANEGVRTALKTTLFLSWSLMLSQAIETVTRAFYARGDLELILVSPAAASRLFVVRLAAMAMTIVAMALLLTAPFIHVLVWLGGPLWLGGYVVALGLAIDAAAIAIMVVAGMFRVLGAKRTRFIAQIIAAVAGAGFAIQLQFTTILAYGAMPSISLADVAGLVRSSDAGLMRWPPPEFLCQPLVLAAFLGLSLMALAAVIAMLAPRFGQFALATGSVSRASPRNAARPPLFRASSPAWALRRKEWTLLLRDPWLVSQTLMQLLYLLPAIFLIWRDFHNLGMTALLVPILIVAAGQLGGGLAWLAVSGEDAPDLIASSPLPRSRVLRAKTEAVFGGVAMIFVPLIVVFGLMRPVAALVALLFIFIAAGSATAIQYWFRVQAKRSVFRKRQTSSRVATIIEALSSTGWAATGALASTGTWFFVFPGMFVLAVVAGGWMVSPARRPAEG